jgi:hypothetical protein
VQLATIADSATDLHCFIWALLLSLRHLLLLNPSRNL